MTSDDPNATTVVADRFRLDQQLARTQRGVVWRALDEHDDRLVAVKIARRVGEMARVSIGREVSLGAIVDDDAICKVFDGGVLPDGRAYAVSELVEGDSLNTALINGPLSIGEAVAVGARIARALAVLHGAGIVHLDIKPHNVLIPGVPEHPDWWGAKVCDLGIAQKLSERSGSGAPRTEFGRFAGTVDFMAPEQITGRWATVATDVYGLSATLFAAIFGIPPYGLEDVQQVVGPEHVPRTFMGPTIVRHLTEAVVVPDEPILPRDLRTLLETGLSVAPSGRTAPAARIAAQLGEMADRSTLRSAMAP